MSGPGAMPVIRLTLESMQHSILHAFSEHTLKMDEMLQEEVERFCQPEAIRRLIAQQVKDSIEHAVKSEVDSFYRYGDGRKTIKEAVIAHLERLDGV